MHPFSRPDPASSNPSLPDPDRHAEFYADVAVKRAMAWGVDTVLITALTALVVPFTGFLALLVLGGLYLLVGFVYRWVSLTRASATPGMRLFAVVLRDGRGRGLDPVTAFVHTLGYTLSMAFVLPQVISVALMLVTPRGQGLSDLVLGTVVINRPSRF